MFVLKLSYRKGKAITHKALMSLKSKRGGDKKYINYRQASTPITVQAMNLDNRMLTAVSLRQVK